MCTATWLTRPGAFHLFFNRDELRTRERATPPQAAESGGIRFLAPRDGRAGGTWLAAAEHGLALALLNRSDGRVPPEAASRGRLIPRLIAAGDPGELAARLGREDLAALPPFRLAAFWFAPRAATLATWDGDRLACEPLADSGLLASSGLGDRLATEHRARLWGELHADGRAPDPARLREFHRAHGGGPSAWSVCMHRDEAETASSAEIRIDDAEVSLRYVDGPPCLAGGEWRLALPRLAAANRPR
jgi:hypothetical protein